MKTCPKCEIPHQNPGTFCSRKCANSRQWGVEDKLKKSLANKGKASHNKGKLVYIRVDKKCLMCENVFTTLPHYIKKYCSCKCAAIGNKSGGYRNGSGRAKTGYYKGIFCGSTYELAWVIYRLDHSLPVNRFNGYLKKDKLFYYPDFIIDNKIIEIKGYHTPLVDEKVDLAISNNYDIEILYKNNLLKEFNWVKDNYNYKHLYELYDKYKPKYEYICNTCNIKFGSNKKRKTDIVYCSRYCAGKRLR